MASFSTGGIGLNGHMGSTFSKRVEFRKVAIPKNDENCPKMIRNGSRKMIQRSGDLRKEQNCAPDPLEGLPEARNPVKNSKKANNHKIRNINDFPYFSYFPVWALYGLFSGVGGMAQPF